MAPAQGVSAVKRELAGGFAWDRAPGITELTAASLAAWGLLSATQAAPRKSLPPLSDTSSGGYREPAFLDLDRVKFSGASTRTRCTVPTEHPTSQAMARIVFPSER